MTGEPIFRSDGDAYAPTNHARGPWDPLALHGGAPAALLAREVEQLTPGDEMFVARMTFEFLSPVPLAPLVADAWIARPGRRFQLVEGELRAEGTVVVRARAVRLRRAELTEGPTEPDPPQGDGPEESLPSPFPGPGDESGFHRTALDMRFANGTTYAAGPAQTWFRLVRPLVDEETPTPLQRVMAAADFGNGISRVLDFDKHFFINTDLSVHLDREPQGEWVRLDARTTIGPQGVGLASSRIFDVGGQVGVAAQSLFVEPR
jgi:Thioesterase-like superfamily